MTRDVKPDDERDWTPPGRMFKQLTGGLNGYYVLDVAMIVGLNRKSDWHPPRAR